MNNYHKTRIILLAFLFLFTRHVFGLMKNMIPESQQTKIKEPQERAISLKLPLLQPYTNWSFMSRKDFLSGKLVLRISRDNKTEQIVIFDNGRFSDGWKDIDEQQVQGKGEIYFGFVSTKKYFTAPGDKLELELTVTKDLPGIGEIQSGILPAGFYKSEGTYSGLIDEYDTSNAEKMLSKDNNLTDEQRKALNTLRLNYSNKAFLESWKEQWPLTITSEKGWLSEKQADLLKKQIKMIEKLNEELKNAQSILKKPKTSTPGTSIKNTTTITGTVYNEKGDPVSDAFVTIPRIFRFKGSTTDINGNFSINASFDEYGKNETPYLVIRHKQKNLAAAVEIKEKTDNIDITLLPGITLLGKVDDPNGNGIQNAKITWIVWTSETGNTVEEPIEINKQGNFQINALPAGFKYTIFAEADGFGRDVVDVQTSQTPGDKYELKPIILKVANLSISGYVVDKNDKPVANADIFMEGIGQQIHDTKTDKNGKFYIDKICEGEGRIEADKFVKPQLSGHMLVQAGSENVKIVISEIDSSGKQMRALSLISKQLPRIDSLFANFKAEKIRDKKVLVCFWDYEQRPSRNCILELNKKSQELKLKEIEIIAVHASKIEQAKLDEWIKENNISFPVGMIEKDEEQTKFNWVVKALPWLILTDKKHVVQSEGFSINELDEKIETSIEK